MYATPKSSSETAPAAEKDPGGQIVQLKPITLLDVAAQLTLGLVFLRTRGEAEK